MHASSWPPPLYSVVLLAVGQYLNFKVIDISRAPSPPARRDVSLAFGFAACCYDLGNQQDAVDMFVWQRGTRKESGMGEEQDDAFQFRLPD
ncbi:hypothetical protein E2562_033285 [Oryza meyeriana var. granulata]|uniref:Uncharacterized protein n=1 Tax=Oryza meyeriana var. granulata TaxID=110450 RepID=A0A6G1CVZ8_9ORYZ|nr:hypothetical protein E2562_033285 [Oryza meyeriana var. granulata]